MKIGIDIRTVCDPKAGKGRYTFHIVKELLAQDKKNEYILYTNAISGDTAKLFEYSTLNPHIKVIHKSPVLWHFAVIKDFKREGGDVFFAPTSFIIPAFLPKKIKSIVTVHDLVSFIHPHLHQTRATVLEHLFFRRAVKRAAHVLVPSENTKKDLVRFLHYPADKISVTHLGVDEIFFKRPAAAHLHGIKKKYNLPDRFILTVGGLEPRKNIAKLVEAFEKIQAAGRENLKLVIVGGKGWKSRKLQEKINRMGGKILHIENCGAGDLPAFYHLAEVFVFPSIYEGFGLPPLESMAAGCPVICSSAGSLSEVCEDAAFMIDPNDTSEISHAIEKILTDKNLKNNLMQKGLVQAQKFSWKQTAERTLQILIR